MNIFKIILIAIVLLLGYVFSDNVKGYYRFTQYCEKEAGLKIYQRLEPDHGWLVDSRGEAMRVAYLKGVKFSRYVDKQSRKSFDTRYISGNPHKKESFEISESLLEEITKYRWTHLSGYVQDETRLGKYGNEVLDNEGNKMIGLYEFSYEKFDRDYTPLDMNPVVRCSENIRSQKESFNVWVDRMNSIFINK